MKKLLAIFSCFALVCSIGLGVTGCTDKGGGKTTSPAKTTTPTGDKTTTPAEKTTTTPAKTTT